MVPMFPSDVTQHAVARMHSASTWQSAHRSKHDSSPQVRHGSFGAPQASAQKKLTQADAGATVLAPSGYISRHWYWHSGVEPH